MLELSSVANNTMINVLQERMVEVQDCIQIRMFLNKSLQNEQIEN